MQINTAFSLWWIIPCLLAAVFVAWLLYTKNPFGDEVKKRSPLYITLMVLRFAIVFVLAFLLLAPFVKSSTKKIQKPVIVVALDNSESVKANKDSAFYKTEYPKKIENLTNKLSKNYDVKLYSIADRVKEDKSFDFIGKQTNLSTLFSEVSGQYENQNLGAIILASDGIYNAGTNPIYAAENIKAPIYTVALGDTTIPRDLVVKEIRQNKIAYLGNEFPVEVTVNAGKLKGKKTTLSINKQGKMLFSKELDIDDDNYQVTEKFILQASEAGTQHYVVRLSTISGEVSYINNRKDFFIEVLDGRNKILLLGASPHPDMTAIKQAVESNQNYEVKIEYAKDFNADALKNYNLVILHQLPSFENPSKFITDKIDDAKLPYLSIVGTQTSIPAFNALGTGITISNYRYNVNDVLPKQNQDFALFTLSDETKTILNYLPPVKSPFGTYNSVASANTLLYQKIGAIETQQPLIYFSPNTSRRVGVIVGDGIWRWRLYDFERNQSHTAVDELLIKTIQYLSAKNDTRKFRVNAPKNIFNENERVSFNAQVYNESYEAITEPDVKMEVKNAEGKVFNYTFSKGKNVYSLNAGFFAAGNYTYKASVTVGNRVETINGKFTVVPLQVELLNTVANHQLMQNLASKNGGEMVYPNTIEKLNDLLSKREDIKPVSYMQTAFKDLIHFKWLFFVLLVLLTAEWFLRRRNGAY
jgi:hypothetical protein